jgi:hypothetical protein
MLTPTAVRSTWLSRRSSSTAIGGRVTLNVPAGYLNLAKAFGFQPDPTNQDSNGYPIATPKTNIVAGSSPSMPANYWGEFVWKWTGKGSMDILASLPMIVSQSSSSAGVTIPVGDNNGGNRGMTSVTAPRIQFLFGLKIQALSDSGVANGSGGTLIRVTTKPGFATNVPSGTQVNVSGIKTQTVANGTWRTKAVDGSHFDLAGTTWSAAEGPSGAIGVTVFRAVGLSAIRITNVGTFSGFSNLVWCKVADETAIANGQITDTVLLNQLKYLLNPNNLPAPNVWLRFMDFSGVQSSWEADFTQRVLPTQLSYNAHYFRTGYWAGTISNRGSDNYECSDPSISVWNGSSYIDNAIVQGSVDVTNSGGFPSLAVGGHEAKPIFNYTFNVGAYHFFASAAPASAGQRLTFQLAASWLNGGSPYNFYYMTVSGDVGDQRVFNNNLATAFSSDPVLRSAGIQFGNPFATMYPRTAQAGRLQFKQISGPSIVTIQTVAPSSLANGHGSFMYNFLLDGWVYSPGGIVMSGPLEIVTEIANNTSAHIWWNWATTKGTFITAATNFFATNLNAGLKLGTEPGNELWNNQAQPWFFWNTLGSTLGFPVGGVVGSYSYGALRMIQYYALSKRAWIDAGRAASDLWVIQPSATFDVGIGGSFDSAQLKGVYLNRSGSTVKGIVNNPTYGTYGGLNGSGAIKADYNIFPNRPVDITSATGCAPYWSSHWLGNGGSIADATSIVGGVAENAPWLQAAKDYSNGLAAAAFTSMVNQFNGVTARSTGTNRGYNFFDAKAKTWTEEEALCAQYDSSRAALGLGPLAIMDYECGPAWGVGSNGINGVNSVNSGDIGALAKHMSSLEWNVSHYTNSGADDKTEMATMFFTMAEAWKNDDSYKTLIKTYYYEARKDASPTREVHAAQFGYSGPGQWALFPGDYTAANPYKSYDAIHEFNS